MTRGRPPKEGYSNVFSERLKLLMRARGMTQRELAKEAGIQESVLCKYTKGKRKPGMEAIIKLAKTLGVSSDYLLGLTNRPTQRI